MSRTPDMVLSVMDKTTGARSGKIGAAWHNEDGSISLVLNPGASLAYNPNLVVMLFPNTPPPASQQPRGSAASKSKHQAWVDAGMPQKGMKRTATVKEALGSRTSAPFPFSPSQNDDGESISAPKLLPFPHGDVSISTEPTPRRAKASAKGRAAAKTARVDS